MSSSSLSGLTSRAADFESGIDMDAGRSRVLPALRISMDERFAAFAKLGVDLWVSPIDSPPSPVHGLDLVAIQGSDSDWDIQSSNLVRRLEGSPSEKGTLLWDAQHHYPATFLVRTREGGMGVLQILGHAGAGWNIRYKMLRAARSAADAAPGLGLREVVMSLDTAQLSVSGWKVSEVLSALRENGILDSVDANQVEALGAMKIAQGNGSAVRLSDVARIEVRDVKSPHLAGGMGPLTRTTPDGRTEIFLLVTGERVAWGKPSNGLQCRLLPAMQQAEPSNGDIFSESNRLLYVTYELRNVSNGAITFLPWCCPIEGVRSSGVFRIQDQKGELIEYRGVCADRMATAKSFITIEPGQTLTNRVALPYDFSKPGVYHLAATKTDSPGIFEDYYGKGSSLSASNPYHVWTGTLVSNEARIEILPARE
jgi:hypothetical protein